MSQHLIIICIVSILLWYYYSKAKEQESKYIPIMMKHSDLVNENKNLKQENKKLKTKIKYLENYKADVSKTFKILDNELVLINDHIKNGGIPIVNQGQPAPHAPHAAHAAHNSFQTSITPSVLNTLLHHSNNNDNILHDTILHDTIPNTPTLQTTPANSIFNNIFNRFLTGEMNFLHNNEADQFYQDQNQQQIYTEQPLMEQDQQLREQRLQEQQLREQRLQEQQLREQRLQEQQLREQRLQEQQLREQRLQEQQLREQRQRYLQQEEYAYQKMNNETNDENKDDTTDKQHREIKNEKDINIGPVQFKVNYMPLNSDYKQFLIKKDIVPSERFIPSETSEVEDSSK